MNGSYNHTSESRYAMSDSLGCYSIPVTYGDEVDRVDSGGQRRMAGGIMKGCCA